MRVGFSGTRAGMTSEQYREVRGWVAARLASIVAVHHGCCVGADVDFHNICVDLGLIKLIQLHPSNNRGTNKLLELRQMADVAKIWPEGEPLERDQVIVSCSSVLLITPQSDDEVVRSGTWATKRKADRMRVPVIHFRVEGEVEEL